MNTILFLGSNPSSKSVDDSAFHPYTKSGKILEAWCKDLVGAKVYINVMSDKTKNNRPMKTSEIKSNISRLSKDIKRINPDRIVALGKTATKALTLLQLKFYELPHPSGLNRKINNPQYVEEKIKKLVEFCNSTSPDKDLPKF